jgi:hypothetical protein
LANQIPKSKKAISSRLTASLRLFCGFAAGAGIWLGNLSAEAADSVVLRYRFIRESVSVPELTTFAETGELSSSLRSYLRLAGQNPEEFRKALTNEVKADPIFLYRTLNSTPGELLLDQVSQVIHTPTNSANRQSLRAALVGSALEDRNITLIEVLQNYPTPEVHVDGDRIVEVYGQISNVLGRLPNINIRL